MKMMDWKGKRKKLGNCFTINDCFVVFESVSFYMLLS